MSIRKEHRLRLQPVLAILKSTLTLSPSEVQSQQQITRNIIQQLLQTDILCRITSPTTLKLIAYELILHTCHQPPAMQTDSSSTYRLCGLLDSMRETLSDMMREDDEVTLKTIDIQNWRTGAGDSKSKNKYRIFLSYCNQFLAMAGKDWSQREVDPSIQKDKERQEALIEQLQSLVYKKQEQLKVTREELQVSSQQKQFLQSQIYQLEEQLEVYKLQTENLHSTVMRLEKESETLQGQIREAINQNHFPVSAELISLEETLLLTPSHPNSSSVAAPREWSCLQSEELLRAVMSQALTLEAMLT